MRSIARLATLRVTPGGRLRSTCVVVTLSLLVTSWGSTAGLGAAGAASTSVAAQGAKELPEIVPSDETKADTTLAPHESPPGEGAVSSAPPSEIAYPPPTIGPYSGFDRSRSVKVSGLEDATSTVYQNPDGSKTAEISTAPVRFKNDKGDWVDIDNSLVAISTDRLQNRAGPATVEIGLNAADPALATIKTDADHVVSYSLDGASEVVGSAAVDSVSYADVLPGIDLELRSIASGLKETILLQTPNVPDTYLFHLNVEGLTPELDKSGSVVLVDETGTARARILRGSMEDSAVSPASGDGAVSYGVSYELKQVDKLNADLEVRLDRSWLDDPVRKYPIRVDPTIETNAGSDDTFVMSPFTNDNSNDLQNTTLKIGKNPDQANSVARSFMHFDTTAVNGKHIIGAELESKVLWSADCNNDHRVNLHRVTNAWVGSQLLTFPGAGIGEVVGHVDTRIGASTQNHPCAGDGSVFFGGASDASLKNLIQAWTNGTTSNYGLAFVSDNEGDSSGWKKFAYGAGNGERLRIDYVDNFPPNINASSPLNNASVMTVQPTLSVHSYDPDSWPGGGLIHQFTVCTDILMTQGCLAPSNWSSSSSWVPPLFALSWRRTYFWRVQVIDTAWGVFTGPVSAFTTTVPQPKNESHFGSDPYGSSSGGVNPAGGNYVTSVVDAAVAGVGPPLSLQRSYNSLDNRVLPFGRGWASGYEMSARTVASYPPGDIVITYADGRKERYGRNPDGSFGAGPGSFATLTGTANSLNLTDKSGTKYHFNSWGRLTRITDAESHVLEIQADTPEATVLWRYSNPLEHWENLDPQPPANYYTDVALGGLLNTQQSGTQPLYSCKDTSNNNNDYFLSLSSTCNGFDVLNQLGYLYDTSQPGTTRLNRCRLLNANGERFASVDPGCEGQFFETTLGFVLTMTAGAGHISQVTNQTSNRHLTFAWTGEHVTSVSTDSVGSPPSSLTWTYGYVGDELRSVCNPKPAPDNCTAYGYTAAPQPTGLLETITLPKGNVFLTVHYDANSRVQWRKDGEGHQWSFAYGVPVSLKRYNNGPDHWVTTGSPNGYLLESVLGSIFTTQISGTTHPLYGCVGGSNHFIDLQSNCGGFTSLGIEGYVYNNPAPYTVPLYRCSTTSGDWFVSNDAGCEDLNFDSLLGYALDPRIDPGMVTTITDPSTPSHQTTWTYGGLGRLVAKTDEAGYARTFGYNSYGFLIAVFDENHLGVGFETDDRGNIVSRLTNRGPTTTYRTYYKYYLDTNPTDPRNDRLTAFRDGRSEGPTDQTYRTKYTYTATGQLATRVSPATTDFPNGRTETWAYTTGTEAAVGGGTMPANLLRTKTDARGHDTTYDYDAKGDLRTITDPVGLRVEQIFDQLGRQTSRKVVSDTFPSGQTTTYTYDELSQPETITEPSVANVVSGASHRRETTYGYDDNENLHSLQSDDIAGGDSTRATTYDYNDNDILEAVHTTDGVANYNTTYLYDERGSLYQVTDPLGTVTQYDYTSRNQLKRISVKDFVDDPINPGAPRDVVVESRNYDPGGRLASVSDAMGRLRTFDYYDDDLLESVTLTGYHNRNGSTRDIVLDARAYDHAGNLFSRFTGGNSALRVFVVDAANRLTSTTFDPYGLARNTAFTYNASDSVTRATRTQIGGTVTETTDYDYDDAERLRSTSVAVDATNDLVTLIDRDKRGLPKTITDPRNNATDYVYDAADQLSTATEPAAAIENVGGQPVTLRPQTAFGYNTFGEPTHARDPRNNVTLTAYDQLGRAKDVTYPTYTTPAGAVITPTSHDTYDGNGNVRTAIDRRNQQTTFDYDKRNRLVRRTDPQVTGAPGPGITRYAYNDANELVSLTNAVGATVTTGFDDLGRVRTETQVERYPTLANFTTTFDYDDAGNQNYVLYPAGETTSAMFNAAGEPTDLTDAAGKHTTLNYDLVGRKTKVTDPLGRATKFVYDLAGRRTKVKDLNPAGTTLRTTTTAYDDNSNPISTTTPLGWVTTRSFDELNRMSSLTEPISATSSMTTSMGYDAAGNQTRLTDGRINATMTTFNPWNLRQAVVEPTTASYPLPADRTWTHTYDAGGLETKEEAPGAVVRNRTFDELGRLASETGSGAASATAPRALGYDAIGRVKTASHPAGTETFAYNDRDELWTVAGPAGSATLSYDSDGRLLSRNDSGGLATFTYDSAGRTRTVADNATNATRTYDYNDASQVGTITFSPGGAVRTYGYDDLARLTSDALTTAGGASVSSISYGYDVDDNLTSKTIGPAGTAGAGIHSYTYDRAERLKQWTAPGSVVTDYGWDKAGNRKSIGGTTATYDERNRLTAETGQTNAGYTYTARGTLSTRVSTTTTNSSFDALDHLISEGSVTYSYDGLDRVATRNGSTWNYGGLTNDVAADGGASYIRDQSGALTALTKGTTKLAALNDRHGDLVGTFNPTSAVLSDSRAYDPFGTQIAQTGTTNPNPGFQGGWTDGSTGRVNAAARWYTPSTGSFASRDSWTLEPTSSAATNRFGYGLASPLDHVDPTGHCIITIDGVAVSCPTGPNESGLVPGPGGSSHGSELPRDDACWYVGCSPNASPDPVYWSIYYWNLMAMVNGSGGGSPAPGSSGWAAVNHSPTARRSGPHRPVAPPKPRYNTYVDPSMIPWTLAGTDDYVAGINQTTFVPPDAPEAGCPGQFKSGNCLPPEVGGDRTDCPATGPGMILVCGGFGPGEMPGRSVNCSSILSPFGIVNCPGGKVGSEPPTGPPNCGAGPFQATSCPVEDLPGGHVNCSLASEGSCGPGVVPPELRPGGGCSATFMWSFFCIDQPGNGGIVRDKAESGENEHPPGLGAQDQENEHGADEREQDEPPPLQLLHPDETLEGPSLDYWRGKPTEEIVESLRGEEADEPLTTSPEGRVLQGNTRIKVLQERGYDVNSLPRQIAHKQFPPGWFN